MQMQNIGNTGWWVTRALCDKATNGRADVLGPDLCATRLTGVPEQRCRDFAVICYERFGQGAVY